MLVDAMGVGRIKMLADPMGVDRIY